MITLIPDVLDKQEIEQVRATLAAASFADGGLTAGWHARGVKNNQQITAGMPGYDVVEALIRPAIVRNAVFQMGVRPRTMLPLLFNRYDAGMGYGAHVDDSVMSMPQRTPVRTDVSFTLFLSDPATYAGGELAIGYGGFEQAFKLPAGSMIAYPSGSLHRVVPVTEGTRFAAVGWVQSEIRLSEQRGILFDLDLARRSVFAREGKSETFDLISKSHNNLLRLWSDF